MHYGIMHYVNGEWVMKKEGFEAAAEYIKYADKAYNSLTKNSGIMKGIICMMLLKGKTVMILHADLTRYSVSRWTHPVLEKEKWETIIKRVKKNFLLRQA
jgi:hypothetical protein